MCFLLIYLQFLKSWGATQNFDFQLFQNVTLRSFKATNYVYFTPWLMYLFVSALSFESFQWGRYSFCFIRICYCFTVWNHDVLLDYMGTPQWELHGDNFTQVPTYWVIHLQLNLDKLEVTVKSILLIYRTPWKADLQDLWACTVSVVAQGHIFLLYSREI